MKTVISILIIAFAFAGCAQRYEVKYDPYQKTTQPPSDKASKPSSSFKYNMKPYTVFGKTYYPSFVSIGEEYSGIASWYGPDFHGKKTANGEKYDMYANTAAHKTLPMNTIAKVTNLNNNKSVVVRINDRGPFVDGRIIDLSYAAGKAVGIDKTGTAPVRLAVLGFDGVIAAKGSKDTKSLTSIAVQIGAFKNKNGADAWAAKHSNVNGAYKALVKTYDLNGEPIHRVMLTGFRSENEARDFIKEGGFAGSFFVSLD